MAEKENLSQNVGDDVQEQANFGTQGLNLALDDSESQKSFETQISPLASKNSSTESQKRPAEQNLTDSEIPKKTAKIDESVLIEEEDIFSDVEVLPDKEDDDIEVVTIGDSLTESTETFSGSKDENPIKDEPLSQSSSRLEAPTESSQISSGSPNIEMLDSVPTSTPDRPPETAKQPSQIEDNSTEEYRLDTVPTSTPDRPPETTKEPSQSGENSSEEYRHNETLKIVSSPEEEFKSPDQDTGYVVVLMKPSSFEKIKQTSKIEDQFRIFQDDSNAQENFSKLKKFMLTNKKESLRRLSEISGLSGGSSGYHADTSSSGGASTISGNSSKRDRLSIMPDTLIQHNVISPLPGRFLKKRALPLAPQKAKEIIPPKFKENLKVFAKWLERTDIKYWPGIVKNEEEEDKYLVLFDDGYEKTVKKEDVIKANQLEPGCQVNVEKEEGVHQTGMILSYSDCSEADDIFYNIQLEASMPNLPETEAEAISYRKIHLTQDQWKTIQAEQGGGRKTSSSIADISLDNLKTGKRKSKPLTPVKNLRKKGGDNVETSVHEDDSEKGSTTDAETNSNRRSTRRKPSTLFKKYIFLLTQGVKANENEGESAMESETEYEDDEEKLEEPKFDRKLLKRKILENGGKVLDKFPGEKEKIPSHVIVVSDRVCQTMTYLLSIAYGFERIHFTWILNCITEKQLLARQNYNLQVGFSKSLNCDIEQLKGNRRQLFKGLHVLIATTDKKFGDDWKPILTRMGASVTVRTKGKLDGKLKAVDYVVGDSTPPSSIVKDATDKGLFIVNTEWVVQCLINGQRIQFGDYLI